MTESARNASVFGSGIADRINEWAKDNPEATEYCLNDEHEARMLLITIAATLKLLMKDMPRRSAERAIARKTRSEMLQAAAQTQSIDYIRELNKREQLEFLGLKITTPDLVLM